MWTLLAIGSIGFWIALILASIVITVLIENAESGGSSATFVCVLTLVLLYVFGAGQDIRDLWTFIVTNPLVVGLAVFAYVVFGAFWSIAKWYFFVIGVRNEFLDNRKLYHGDERNNKLTQEELESKIPSARNNKARITSWMFYWPFSALFTLVNEPIKKVFNTIYRRFTASYDRISKKVFMSSEVLAYKKEEKEAKS
jgi:hypothetical protein